MLINFSICLTDIPKERIKVANNGKKYLKVSIQDLRVKPDQYGNTHSMYCAQDEEERKRGDKRFYIGNGRELVFVDRRMTAEDVEAMPTMKPDDDLPF